MSMEISQDEAGDLYTPCGDCDDGRAYLCPIVGTSETYLEHACGKCGRPLCSDCYDAGAWMYDGAFCCRQCSDEMDEEGGEA